MNYIPYGRQAISEADIEAVIDVLKSDFLTQGPKVPEFESSLAKYTNSTYAVAVNSATSALHIACRALGVGPGDIVWTSPITFVASSNCALYCGADIDFVDICPLTYNISADLLEKKLIKAEVQGKLPKVIIPVHFSGQPCEMEKISNLSKRFNFKIIEDASHAIGAHVNGEYVGSCKFSEMCVFSFHPVKIITTAEGGVITTNDPSLANSLLKLRSHGITRDAAEMIEHHGGWYYEQQELGYNYRMTEIQAALGISQLSRVSNFVESRHRVKELYDQKLKDLPLILPFVIKGYYSSFHLYVIRLDKTKTNLAHKDLFDFLRSNNIGVNLHYIPVYKHPYYQKIGFKQISLPNAEAYYETALSLPMYPSLKTEEINFVVSKLSEFFDKGM